MLTSTKPITRFIIAATFFSFLSVVLQPAFCQGLYVEKAEKETQLFGYTRSGKAITLSSEVPGKIVKINYDIGDDIGSAPIFEIDTTFIDYKIENTKRSLEKLDINIKRLEERRDYVIKEFKRIDELFKGDRITAVKRDEAEQGVLQAKLELESVTQDRAMLVLTLKELKERRQRHFLNVPNSTYFVKENVFVRSGPSSNHKQLGKLFKGAQIKIYEKVNGWTRIGKDKWITTSVIDAKVSKGLIMTARLANEGEIIAPGIPLARISDFRELVVPLTVSGDELSAFKKLPDPFIGKLEGKNVKVSIEWINPLFDEITRKLSLELVIKNYQGEKRGGLKLEVPLQTKTEGYLIPKAAVLNRYANPKVTLTDTGEEVPIIVIDESGDNLIIAETPKLAPGMELMLKNPEYMKR